MTRPLATIAVVLVLACFATTAEAQPPRVRISIGTTFGGYSPWYGGYGGYLPGYGLGNYGYGPAYGLDYGGYGLGYGYGYGGLYDPISPLNTLYSQQLAQQQASLSQQIYEQQQQAIIGQVRQAQEQLGRLDELKEQLFKKYLRMNESDKGAVRTGLIDDYLNLDAHGRAGWKRDAVVQIIIGKDLERLDGVAEFREMNETDKNQLRQEMLRKYRSLPAAEQTAWQRDQIVGIILGKEWWLK